MAEPEEVLTDLPVRNHKNGSNSPELKNARSNGDHDYIVLSTPEIESDTGSVVSSLGKCKSQGSSIGSFAEMNLPDTEARLEKDHTEEELARLVDDARKESPCSNEESQTGFKADAVESDIESSVIIVNKTDISSNPRPESPRERAQSENFQPSSDIVQPDGSMRQRAGTDPGEFDDEYHDEDVVTFDDVTYLGSSTVNAPVSEIELKRTMAILREQTQVTIDVLLCIGSTSDGLIRLVDPDTKSDIATYRIQRILFCGRGDASGSERDCFAFNTVHGDTDIFHCHVFRCKEPDMAGKILKYFALSFRKHRKRRQQSQQAAFDEHPVVSNYNNLQFKFELTLDIMEEEGKGLTSVARDKTCFKLRKNLQKKVVVTVQQLSNKHLIVERCFGLLLCPGRNVRYSDMHLLSEVTMEVVESGRTNVITGHWDPTLQDLLVLNTETPKDTRVFVTVAVDLVVTGISEPVRFIKETKARIFPTGETFWSISKPKCTETYIMELKEVTDESGQKGYEVKSLQPEAVVLGARSISPPLANSGNKSSEDDEDDDEPLLSGSGQVQKECSEEELCSWSELLSKWKDIAVRPKQVNALVRKGVPDRLRGHIWQMLAKVDENDEMLQSYKHLIKKDSPAEQVIMWDMHRTFPAHEFFKDSGGDGQSSLYRISKAYSVYDEEVGYCQGFSFISAVLLLHMPEEQAFALLVKIMSDYGQRDLIKNEFEMLHLQFFQLERMIEDSMPDLWNHLQHNGVESHMYASQWFLTLFTAKFPLPMVYWIMDAFLSEGKTAIFQVALALLKSSKKDLLQMDFEGILKYFRVNLPKKYMEEEQYKQLMSLALGIKVTVKKLKKYEKEYQIKKEQEAQLEDPVERFKRENRRLMEANMRLEQENDVLAHELVTNKVELHSKLVEAEEKVEDLSAEVTILRSQLTETDEEKEKFKNDGLQVKEMWRKSMQEAEDDRKRHTSIIEEYKKICTQLDERSEKFQADLQKEVAEIKRRIGSCERCAPLFLQEENEEGESAPTEDGFKTTIKVVDSDKRLRELELELAQTKLSLVEAECRAQDLEHKLAAVMAALQAEENKPWFKKIGSKTSTVKDTK